MRQLFTLFLLSMLLFSCHEKKDSYGGKKVFRYNESSGITSLDPAFANNQANIWACNHLFNGLVQLDEKLHVLPCIASSWEVSDDAMTYTFHLRNEVTFHQDPLFTTTRKVIAADFLYSFNRIADKKVASSGAWIFNSIKKNQSGEVIGFINQNDSTFIILLDHPFPPFLGLLASSYAAVVPHEIVDHYGKDFRNHPIGTGPFLFSRWIERIALILHKNPNYFELDKNGKRLPYLDAIMISFISDKQSAFLEFLKGKLDLVSGLDASYKDDLLTPNGKLRSKYMGRFQMETAPYLNTEYLGMLVDSNLTLMKGNPLNDVRIRQAINMGFDRAKMITYLRNGMATPGEAGMIPLGIPGFDSLSTTGYRYDPKKAAQLLADAGYPNGKGLPPILMSTTNSYQDLCEYIQGQLAEIGITIKLEINQAGQHRQMVSKQQLSFFRGSWIADYADAENYLALFYSKNKAPNGPNYTHYFNLQFDKMYEQSMLTSNDTLRWKLYRDMDNLVMKDAPVVVLYYDRVLRLFGNNVHGLKMNPLNLVTLKEVEMK